MIHVFKWFVFFKLLSASPLTFIYQESHIKIKKKKKTSLASVSWLKSMAAHKQGYSKHKRMILKNEIYRSQYKYNGHKSLLNPAKSAQVKQMRPAPKAPSGCLLVL